MLHCYSVTRRLPRLTLAKRNGAIQVRAVPCICIWKQIWQQTKRAEINWKKKNGMASSVQFDNYQQNVAVHVAAKFRVTIAVCLALTDTK